MTEIIDIYDANLKPLGHSERLTAHLEGQWHKTFHLWIASSHFGGSLIFQLRSPHAKNYPDLLDITAAGHLLAGESVEQGIREVFEELGVSLNFKDLHNLGYRVEVADQENGQRNREYQAVFLTQDDRLPEEFRPDPNEVYGLLYLPISPGMQLFTGKVSSVTVGGIFYDKEQNRWQNFSDSVTVTRFLPRIQNYYLTMLIMAERLLRGEATLAIS